MTETIHTVRVNLSQRGYDIDIGTGILDQAGAFVSARTRATHVVIVTDENVEKPHAVCVAESLAALGAEVDLLVIEAGEPAKCVQTAEQLGQLCHNVFVFDVSGNGDHGVARYILGF